MYDLRGKGASGCTVVAESLCSKKWDFKENLKEKWNKGRCAVRVRPLSAKLPTCEKQC